MGGKEEETTEPVADIITSDSYSTIDSSSPVQNLGPACLSSSSTESDASNPVCRFCHCTESDLRGDLALAFLGIIPPSLEQHEIQICIEAGPTCQGNSLTELGCSCNNELSLAHYSCALKWFAIRASTICEICGMVAKNVRMTDFRKVLASLKDYDELFLSRITGGSTMVPVQNGNRVVDPDLDHLVAGIRHQSLSVICSWFNPRNSSSVVAVSQGQDELHVSIPSNGDNVSNGEACAGLSDETRWLILFWLTLCMITEFVAPHVSKTVAVNVVYILLAGLCSLTLIIFLRFVVPCAKYGPTKYWIISFPLLLLLLGDWWSHT